MNLWHGLLAGVALALVSSVGMAQDEKASETPAATQPAESQPVDFRKLKELLPETLGGLPRTDASGEKVAVGDFKLSQARGEYQGGDEENLSTLNIEITDYGANPEMVEGMAYWKDLDIDQESDDGYQRTIKIGTWPALESYQNDGQAGTLLVVVADRFLINLNTYNLPAEQIQKSAQALPLDKLAELK